MHDKWNNCQETCGQKNFPLQTSLLNSSDKFDVQEVKSSGWKPLQPGKIPWSVENGIFCAANNNFRRLNKFVQQFLPNLSALEVSHGCKTQITSYQCKLYTTETLKFTVPTVTDHLHDETVQSLLPENGYYRGHIYTSRVCVRDRVRQSWLNGRSKRHDRIRRN